jgi:hypothetical protein
MKKLTIGGTKPYNKANDKVQDAKTTRGLDKEEKAKFEKMDKKHRKPVNQKEDSYMDKANVERIKERERAHEAKEGKKGEKAEDKKEVKKKKPTKKK